MAAAMMTMARPSAPQADLPQVRVPGGALPP